MGSPYIRIDKADNVATALAELPAGSTISLVDDPACPELILVDTIAFGHKFAVQDIPATADVIKYGATPGHDIESVTGMVAGGAQVVIFTTGRGTPTGCPIAPAIKVTGNSATYRRMAVNIDINAGVAIGQGVDGSAIAADLFDELVTVCDGKLTKAERLGHREMAIFRVGQTF
jgi:altronate dehydratase